METLRLPAAEGDVIEKRAEAPADGARLRREHAVLDAARDVPGVPAVVAWSEDPPALVLAATAGMTARDADPLPLRSIAETALGLARTLGGLHELGIVHGAVEPAHVVLGAAGPVLCGFGVAGRVGEPRDDDPTLLLDPVDDVAGWGDLVAHLLDYAAVFEPDPSSGPGRRPPGRRGGDADAAAREQLAALADDARHPDPHLRPSATALAVAVQHRLAAVLVPAAETHAATSRSVRRPGRRTARPGLLDRLDAAGRPATVPSPPGPHTPGRLARRPRPWALAAAAGVGAVVLVGVVPGAVASLKPARPALGAVGAAPASCAPVAGMSADIDGDGCDEAVSWADGVLQAGRARFALGGPGDRVVVGDWDGDGRRTPAVLEGGRLVVYDAWPAPGGSLDGRVVATVPAATGLAVVRGTDGRERPSIARGDGPDLVVEAAR